MTEVERIVREGIIPREFLEPEIRNDFLVDVDRKKLWAISLDLLIKFDEVCRKQNLQYYMIGGSLLGIIRHQGFIPWDDDIDVCMLREDYDRFTEIAKNEFEQPYFWQTPETDEAYLYSCNKLRNSNTSAIVETFRHAGFNQGIWLSIFPLDNTILEGADERHNKIKELNQENSAHMRRSNPNPTKTDVKRLKRFPYRDPKKVIEELQSIATQFNDQDTELLQIAVCTIYSSEKETFKKSCFDNIIYKDFENVLSVPIPAGYDECLQTCYGDYWEFPPVEERGMWHDGTIFNPDKPYSDYIFD